VCGADADTAVEQARSMAMLAAMMTQEPDAAERRRAMAAVKVQIGRSARFVGQQRFAASFRRRARGAREAVQRSRDMAIDQVAVRNGGRACSVIIRASAIEDVWTWRSTHSTRTIFTWFGTCCSRWSRHG
jgi:hypothetical protein